MRKKLLAMALLIFSTNLGATQVWYINESGDNYYPKTNVMTAALVSILGQQKTNNFLAGKTVSISPAQAKQFRLRSHVKTITNYNPKSYSTTSATQTYKPPTTYRAPTTSARSTTTRTRGTTQSRGRTRTTAPVTSYKPPTTYTKPAAKPAASRSRGRARGRTAAAPTVTPTPAATMAPQNGRIQELESKVKQLTDIVLQLQQQLGG